MKLLILNTILSITLGAVAAKAESHDASIVDLLVKKMDELTAEVEALKLQQSLSQNDRRLLGTKSHKSSKVTSTPTSKPTTSSVEPVACAMTQNQCSDLKTNVLNTQAHQTTDIYLTHTEQCQAFKFLLEKAGDPIVRDNLLKAMHCETVPDDGNPIDFEMVDASVGAPGYYKVNSTDPYGPQYQACQGFLNVGICAANNPFPCQWFTNGYVANYIDIPIGQDVTQKCADYCMADNFCKASYMFTKAGNEQTCNIIHVSPTIPNGSRYTCGLLELEYCFGGVGNSNQVFVKQEKGSNYCIVNNATPSP